MSYYLKLTERAVLGLRSHKDLVALYVEVQDDGAVAREIGVNAAGAIVHVFPSPHDWRGLFDLSPFDTTHLESDLSSAEFEALWRERC